MKTSNIILTISFLLFGLWAQAQKEINKKLNIGDASQIELSHEYADVKINTWNKDYVKVTAHLNIYEDQFDIFNMSLDKKGKSIFLNTKLNIEELDKSDRTENGSTSNSTITRVRKEITKINGRRIPHWAEVNIEVFIPKSLEIKVESTFGSIKAYDINQKINIVNTYADIDVVFESLVSGSSLESSYSNIDVYLPKTESVRILADTGFGKIYSDIEEYELANQSDYQMGQEAEITLGSGQKTLNLDSGYQNIYVRTKERLPRISN